MNTIRPLCRLASVALLGSLLSSCASVSVMQSATAEKGAPESKPKRILVEPFSTEGAKVGESFARKDKGTLVGEAQRLLAEGLVQDLAANVAPAKLATSGAAAKPGDWIVSGRITRVAEGSRLLRMGFGLGLGGTKLETQVAVRTAGKEPFLTFATTGGSGATPGAATNPIPFSSIPTAALHVNEGVTDDSNRTAAQITARIAKYMVGRGWMAADKAPTLKVKQ